MVAAVRASLLLPIVAVLLAAAGAGPALAQKADRKPDQKKEMSYSGKKLLALALEQNGGETGWCKRAKEHGESWAPAEAKRLNQILVKDGEISKTDAGPAIKQLIQYTKRHCAAKPMDEAEVRKVLIGNTIRVKSAANGRVLLVYFGDGGTVLMNSPAKPARIVRKKWFFKENGVICRTIGKQNKNHCTGVKEGDADGTLEFSNKKANISYQAALLPGKQLAK